MGLKQLSRKLGLADDGLKSADAKLLVVRNGDRDRGIGGAFLHHDMTASAADLAESL
jgi:hypothetical protein